MLLCCRQFSGVVGGVGGGSGGRSVRWILRKGSHCAATSPRGFSSLSSSSSLLLSCEKMKCWNSMNNNSSSSSTGHHHFCYSTLSKEEEEIEKNRVSFLSPEEKKMELKKLDEEIAHLNTLRGINTGELYTFRGKFKALARDYGLGFVAWYWCVWVGTAGLTYATIQFGNVDVMALLERVDVWTGYEVSSKVDPTLGTVGLTLLVNELLEPIRMPFVVITTKPIVDRFSQ